ncbi:MAG: hypothetical protein A2521_06520 [Deltaproteobacteria bacterium RIFOXYD12_FULL_57_12]|nr:MAG: hypothetical protein A2521_06520 [Deltaproteobacteria bacterium RIFOXYD12_FULL_57_12]
MELAERLNLLQRLDLFESLNEEDRHFVAGLVEIELKCGDFLFKDGDPAQDMFVLMAGKLEIQKLAKMITCMEPVDYVGEMALIEDKPRSATVRAVFPSLLLKVSRPHMQQYLDGHPAALFSMLRSLSRKIRHDTEMIAQEFEKANILIHDMKNFLTPLLYLDLLARDTPPGPARRYIEVMQKCRQHLTELVAEALAIAKRQALPYIKERHSLPDLLTDLLTNELYGHPELADKVLRTELRAPLPNFPFNRLEIRRVLTNLLLNAAQASPAGGVITVIVDQQGDQAVVQVKDHGAGVEAHIGDRIFDPHFTTKETGNGLGLASCRQIIEKNHGGVLKFSSVPGVETIFTFSLPLATAGRATEQSR